MDFEDSNKLFVFDKKEVVLIFVFVLVITVTSFTLGVRVGKGLSLKNDGFNEEDIAKTVNLKSIEEERADAIINDKDLPGLEDSLSGDKSDTSADKLKDLADPERLDKEFLEISDEKDDSLESQIPSDIKKKEIINANVDTPVGNELAPKEGSQFQGKFTINLASRKTRAEAEEYAAPYMASDLEVVINKVNTTSKGTWYRIGIGAFNTYNEAKSFLEKNPIFFKGKKYWITEIK